MVSLKSTANYFIGVFPESKFLGIFFNLHVVAFCCGTLTLMLTLPSDTALTGMVTLGMDEPLGLDTVLTSVATFCDDDAA